MDNSFKKINGVWCSTIKLVDWIEYFNYPVEVNVNLGGDSKVENVQEKHLVAYQYLLDNQGELLQNILKSLFSEYSSLQRAYDYDELEIQEYMPNVNLIDDFRELISLKRIHILNTEKNGLCYIGFHFECNWDDEQELGFMTHEKRVVKIGGADCSFMSWVAEEDKYF